MGREVRDTNLLSVPFHGRPNNANRHFGSLRRAVFRSSLEHFSLCYMCALQPKVDEVVAPCRYRYGP